MAEQQEEKQYMTTGEAARYLCLSEKHIRNMHKSGELPALIAPNGFRFFAKSDLEKLAADRAKNPRRLGRPPRTTSVKPMTETFKRK